MTKKELNFVKAPIKVPVTFYKKMYSEPKIQYKYKTTSTGKKVLCVAKGSNWYVYFYYRNPITDKIEDKFIFKKGINRYKTVAERKKAAKELLADGFSPYKEYSPTNLLDANNNEYTILTAFQTAFDSRWNELKDSTKNSNNSKFSTFKGLLHTSKLEHLPMDMFKRKHVVQFLDYIKESRNTNSTTRNNYKRVISSILSKIVELDIIEYNPADKVKMLK